MSRDDSSRMTSLSTAVGFATILGVFAGLYFNHETLREVQRDRELRAAELVRREQFDQQLLEREIAAAQKPAVRFAHEYLRVGPEVGEANEFRNANSLPLKNFGEGPALEVTVRWYPDRGTIEGREEKLTEEQLGSVQSVTIPSRIGPGETAMLHLYPRVANEKREGELFRMGGTGMIEYEDVEGNGHFYSFRFTIMNVGKDQLLCRIIRPRRMSDLSPGFW